MKHKAKAQKNLEKLAKKLDLPSFAAPKDDEEDGHLSSTTMAPYGSNQSRSPYGQTQSPYNPRSYGA